MTLAPRDWPKTAVSSWRSLWQPRLLLGKIGEGPFTPLLWFFLKGWVGGGGRGGLYTGYSWRSFFNSNLLFKLEKNKVHIQQLEGDVIRCREQVSRSEEECRAAQRELKRLQMDADDQRDALANEVSCTKNNNNNAYFPLSFYLQ